MAQDTIGITRSCAVREGPDKDYQQLITVDRGTIVQVVRTAAPWVNVRVGEVEGWIPQGCIR